MILLAGFFRHASSRRKFFENFARENGFDPRKPENWTLRIQSRISHVKEARTILRYHSNSVPQALLDLFPNIGWDLSKLNLNNRWGDVRSRRKFFKEYAKKNGFDPLVPENWYLQSSSKIEQNREAESILRYHGNSVAIALLDLFPNIGLDQDRLGLNDPWRQADARRKFFEQYAAQNRFDPLVASNWYSQNIDGLRSMKGVRQLLRYHQGSMGQALAELFPHVGVEKRKLRWKSRWGHASKRRQFFVDYAKAKGFDPLAAENWYSQPKKSIFDAKGASGVMQHHNHSLAKALLDLFPDIGLMGSSFRTYSSSVHL